MLLLDEGGLDFRATKDIDVVLYVEAVSAEFLDAFWTFVKDGGYKIAQQGTGERLFYRFRKPENEEFPEMVELFSRKPDAIGIREGSHLTPISINEELASLSAILLEDDYYTLALNGRKLIDGLPVLQAEFLIPFKAKAWLDLSRRRESGEAVDGKDIRKHRNDVFRLYQIISGETKVDLTASVAEDLRIFIDATEESNLNIRQLGILSFTLADALQGMREVYGLD